MTQEALKLAIQLRDTASGYWTEQEIPIIDKLIELLAQHDSVQAKPEPEHEPVKVLHKHEWFRTNEMKVGQMRCISCGVWGQEETPQRTWVGLSVFEIDDLVESTEYEDYQDLVKRTEAKLKQKNGYAEEKGK